MRLSCLGERPGPLPLYPPAAAAAGSVRGAGALNLPVAPRHHRRGPDRAVDVSQ